MKIQVEIDENDVLSEMDSDSIISYIGISSALDNIGEEECKSYFDLLSDDDIEDYISENISDIAKKHKEEILECYTIEEIKAHFNIIEVIQ